MRFWRWGWDQTSVSFASCTPSSACQLLTRRCLLCLARTSSRYSNKYQISYFCLKKRPKNQTVLFCNACISNHMILPRSCFLLIFLWSNAQKMHPECAYHIQSPLSRRRRMKMSEHFMMMMLKMVVTAWKQSVNILLKSLCLTSLLRLFHALPYLSDEHKHHGKFLFDICKSLS